MIQRAHNGTIGASMSDPSHPNLTGWIEKTSYHRSLIAVIGLGVAVFLNLLVSNPSAFAPRTALSVNGSKKKDNRTSKVTIGAENRAVALVNTTNQANQKAAPGRSHQRAAYRRDRKSNPEFAKIESASITWWLDDEDDKQRFCEIGSQWRFLGNGGTHFAFVTNYTCRQNDAAGIWSEPRQVVVRLASRKELKPRKVRYYISMDDELERGRAFSRHLQGTWSNEQIDRHFAIPKGQVEIPADFFQEFAGAVTGRGHVVGVDDTETSIRGELSDFCPGQGSVGWHLRHTQYLTPARRLRVIQDLVTIFRHMRQHGVAHCDMHLGHVLVVEDDETERQLRAGNAAVSIHLKIIDFERTRTDIDNDEHTEMFRLWQLMGMIGVTCGSINQHPRKDDYSVKSNICRLGSWTDVATYESQILPDLEKCPFVKPLDWTRDLLTDIPKAYRTLAELVGLPEEQGE